MNEQNQRFQSFGEFWPFYLSEHKEPRNRLMHVTGTLLSNALGLYLLCTGRYIWIIGSVLLGYAFAWAGHFFLQKNRPATLKYPFWSFAADYKMTLLVLAGRISLDGRRDEK